MAATFTIAVAESRNRTAPRAIALVQSSRIPRIRAEAFLEQHDFSSLQI